MAAPAFDLAEAKVRFVRSTVFRVALDVGERVHLQSLRVLDRRVALVQGFGRLEAQIGGIGADRAARRDALQALQRPTVVAGAELTFAERQQELGARRLLPLRQRLIHRQRLAALSLRAQRLGDGPANRRTGAIVEPLLGSGDSCPYQLARQTRPGSAPALELADQIGDLDAVGSAGLGVEFLRIEREEKRLGAQELRLGRRLLFHQRSARGKSVGDAIALELHLDQHGAGARAELLGRELDGAPEVFRRRIDLTQSAIAEPAPVDALGGDGAVVEGDEAAESVGGAAQPGLALGVFWFPARRRLEIDPIAQVEGLQGELLAFGELLRLEGIPALAGQEVLLRFLQPIGVPLVGHGGEPPQIARRAAGISGGPHPCHQRVEIADEVLLRGAAPGAGLKARQASAQLPDLRGKARRQRRCGDQGRQDERQRRGGQAATGKTTRFSPSLRHWL